MAHNTQTNEEGENGVEHNTQAREREIKYNSMINGVVLVIGVVKKNYEAKESLWTATCQQ